jgi:hypothetical protein
LVADRVAIGHLDVPVAGVVQVVPAVLEVREVLGGFQWFVIARRPEPLELILNPR